MTIQFLVRVSRTCGEVGSLVGLEKEDAGERVRRACLAVPLACPRCGSSRRYELGGARLRCAACRLTYRFLTGRWLARHRMPASAWLAVIKAFELGLPLGDTARLARIADTTACQALETIRLCLAASDPAWRDWALRTAAGEAVARPEMFGIRHEAGGVRVVPLPGWEPPASVDIRPQDHCHFNGFSYSLARGEFSAVLRKVRGSGRVHARGVTLRAAAKDPFLTFILNESARRFGVSEECFGLYLKDWEFRFNHRGEALGEKLLALLAGYVAAPAKALDPARAAA